MSPADDDEREGFLSAWSRRKLAARRKQADTVVDPDEPDALAPLAESEAEAVSEEPVELDGELVDDDFIANLPSIEDITEKTDLTPFMRRGVPLGLRNAALRKVWMLNPLIRDHVDAALDYAWDWNAPGGVPGGGGTLTGEGVAQMVRNVLGDEKLAEARSDSAEDMAESKTDAEEAPDAQLGVAPEQPVRRTEAPDRELPTEESPDTASPASEGSEPATETRVNLPLTAIRRHGGALPE